MKQHTQDGNSRACYSNDILEKNWQEHNEGRLATHNQGGGFFFGSLNQNLSSIQTTNAYTTHIHTCAYIHHVHIEQQQTAKQSTSYSDDLSASS